MYKITGTFFSFAVLVKLKKGNWEHYAGVMSLRGFHAFAAFCYIYKQHNAPFPIYVAAAVYVALKDQLLT